MSRDQYEYDLVLTTTTTLNSCCCSKQWLPDAGVAQCVEAWAAGWKVAGSNPTAVKYFVIIFLNFFELFHFSAYFCAVVKLGGSGSFMVSWG